MKVSRAGLDLIKSFEGFRAKSAKLSNERWTIGYGHTRSARENITITERDAEDLLRYDLQLVERAVSAWVLAPLNQNEFDALVSLAWNIGLQNFKSSDVLAKVNSGEMLVAAEGFSVWRKAKVENRMIVVDALVRRRAAEKAMFLDHPGGRPIAPSSVVRPERDIALSITLPNEEAVDVKAPVTGNDAGPRTVDDTAADSTARRAAMRTPEQAAAIVTARLSRILEEEESKLDDPNDLTAPTDDDFDRDDIEDDDIEDVPAVEDDDPLVSKAQSNLAEVARRLAEYDEQTAPLPPQQQPSRLNAAPPQSANDDGILVDTGTGDPEDGLKQVDIDDTAAYDWAEAHKKYGETESTGYGSQTSWWSVTAFSLMTLICAAMIYLGGLNWWDLQQSERVISQNELYAGPFLILIGAIGLVIGLYYLIRELFGVES